VGAEPQRVEVDVQDAHVHEVAEEDPDLRIDLQEVDQPQQRHHQDQGHEQGQRHVAEGLPGGGAVDARRLVGLLGQRDGLVGHR
jgi:hypothetical protein